MEGEHLELWHNARSDDEYRTYLPPQLRDHIHCPRLQFLYSDAQEKTYFPLRYTLPVGGVRPWHTVAECVSRTYSANGLTYERYMRAYWNQLPSLKQDVEYHVVTHQVALEHVQSVWKLLLHLFYGRRPTFEASAIEQARIVANAMPLIDYLQVSDTLSPALADFVTSIPGIWEEVPVNPHFFLMLGHLLKSVELYIDAVKHIVGPKIMKAYVANQGNSTTTLRRHIYEELNAEKIPEDVVDFILEARHNMHEACVEVQHRLLEWCELSHTSEPSQLLHGKASFLARLILINYLTTGYLPRTARWPEALNAHSNRRWSADKDWKTLPTLPGMWKDLWKWKEQGDLTDLFVSRELYNDAAVHGIHWKELHDAMLIILQLDLGHILDDYVLSTSSIRGCNSCTRSRECFSHRLVYEQRYDRSYDGEDVFLCPSHQHHAKHHDVPYSTILHRWGDVEHLNQGSTWAWPPASHNYRLHEHRGRSLHKVDTAPATREELIALGLREEFQIPLREKQWLKHIARREKHAMAANDDFADITDSSRLILGTPYDGTEIWQARRRISNRCRGTIPSMFLRMQRKTKPGPEPVDDVGEAIDSLIEHAITEPADDEEDEESDTSQTGLQNWTMSTGGQSRGSSATVAYRTYADIVKGL